MFTRQSVHVSFTIAMLSTGILLGCGPGTLEPPDTVPVSGFVMLKGKPAAGCLVQFHPAFDIGEIKFIPHAETGADGKFTLSTGVTGNGAPPGDYVVTIERMRVVSDRKNSGIEIEVDDFQGRYSDPTKSTWSITITEDENVLEPFELN